MEKKSSKFVVQLCANLESTYRCICLYPLFQAYFKPSLIAHSSAIMLGVTHTYVNWKASYPFTRMIS